MQLSSATAQRGYTRLPSIGVIITYIVTTVISTGWSYAKLNPSESNGVKKHGPFTRGKSHGLRATYRLRQSRREKAAFSPELPRGSPTGPFLYLF